MIYLYALPSTAFNIPQLGIPLLNGYLRKSSIITKQVDLSMIFFKNCFKKDYIKKTDINYYNSLDSDKKIIVNNIESYIKIMKDKKIDTFKIIKANEGFLNYLEIIGKYYNIEWGRRGLNFSKKIVLFCILIAIFSILLQ